MVDITLLFIGTSEIIFIFLIVLLLFGSKKITEIARALGKGYGQLQRASDEIKNELTRTAELNEIPQLKKKITDTAGLEDLTLGKDPLNSGEGKAG